MSRRRSRESDSEAEAAVEVAVEAVASIPRPPTTALPDRTPKLTVRRALITRRFEPLVKAFFVEEAMRHGMRKLTRAEWSAEFKTFLEAPRG